MLITNICLFCVCLSHSLSIHTRHEKKKNGPRVPVCTLMENNALQNILYLCLSISLSFTFTCDLFVANATSLPWAYPLLPLSYPIHLTRLPPILRTRHLHARSLFLPACLFFRALLQGKLFSFHNATKATQRSFEHG